jgi:hypothetical protein
MKIFISYRRADSKSITLPIRLRLEREADFDVFQDITNIPDGYDFRTYLRDGVAECDVLLVIIGDKWVSVTDDAGVLRLNNPEDFVRIEVRTGLERQPNCLVLPVLVNHATPPTENQLPDDLKKLAFLNMGRKVREDGDFETDMQKIISAIRQFNPDEAPTAYKTMAINTFKPSQAVQDYHDALDQQDWQVATALISQIERYKIQNPARLQTFDVQDARDEIEERRGYQSRDEEYDILKITARKTPNRLAKALENFWRIYPNYDPDNLRNQIPPSASTPQSTPVAPSPKPVIVTPPPPMSALAEAIALARAFNGKRNRDWTPYIAKLGR